MIKGLSDQRKNLRLGKIHLGKKQASGKTGNLYPSATDYFVVHADENTSQEMAERFHRHYGEFPKELNIIFPSDNVEEFFPQYLRRYGGGVLLCRGDGENATEFDPDTGEAKEIVCSYKDCPYYQQRKCREVGNLQFILQEIPGGVWQIDSALRLRDNPAPIR